MKTRLSVNGSYARKEMTYTESSHLILKTQKRQPTYERCRAVFSQLTYLDLSRILDIGRKLVKTDQRPKMSIPGKRFRSWLTSLLSLLDLHQIKAPFIMNSKFIGKLTPNKGY